MNNKSPDEIRAILEKFNIFKPIQTESEYENLGYGNAIPDHLPYFVMTSTTRIQAEEIASRMKIGKKLKELKVIGWYGPPGTGKNTLAREIAACLRLPFREFDLGQGFDLLELIGGTGLRGNQGATETVAIEGPLTTYAKIGSIIALNEVVNVDGIQLSILHAMIQERQISLPSAESVSNSDKHGVIYVHDDTFFVFTWNPDLRNPDRQMPPPALLDRMRARRFDADTEEDEVNKLTSRLKYALDKHVTPDAVRDDVRLIRELRKAYENGQLARCPYMRTLEDFAMTRHTLGNEAAFESLLNLCDQDPEEFNRQRDDVIRRHFQPYFGNVHGK